MEEQFNYPGNDRDELKWNKEDERGRASAVDNIDSKGLEHNGPNKDGHFNVLNKDGSFADYTERMDGHPQNDTNAGMLGIGT